MADKYVKLNDIIDALENEWGYEGMREDLEKLPTADVVEVVRCKDCKYHHWEQEPEHGKTIHLCSVLNAEVFKDFYCYHGTPKERGGEK